MPLLRLTTSAQPSNTAVQTLLRSVSRLVAERLGKPEGYVMTSYAPATMTFAGGDAPCAFIELKSIGRFSSTQTKELSQTLCSVVGEALRIAPDRIYIEFADAQAHLWGHDGDTFG